MFTCDEDVQCVCVFVCVCVRERERERERERVATSVPRTLTGGLGSHQVAQYVEQVISVLPFEPSQRNVVTFAL